MAHVAQGAAAASLSAWRRELTRMAWMSRPVPSRPSPAAAPWSRYPFFSTRWLSEALARTASSSRAKWPKWESWCSAKPPM
ncbi:hypothetical protein ACFQZ0_31010 [Streptomyces erythrogriseus]